MCEDAATDACSQMKVVAGNVPPAANLLNESDLSMSIYVRTRKMVNYACQGQGQEKS